MAHNDLTERARRLRVDQTDVERFLWGRLRDRRLGGWKWKRQAPRGAYIVDFMSAEASLIVELDGGQHADVTAYDARRTAYLEGEGFKVIRFWNPEVVTNLDGVCDTILAACGGERPSP
ncbi:endonuclease domain-containing protein [Caulobacter sp. NIBR2454]|uniref:endonuclease domain-containing protein n=1 Tax=Caulobacter sp. NIBR2454 TaxID=3015996 RepID=UPI0022B72B7E|nr:endonuclease domain-containing protein [Caulobacter sp. NIBR2454]